MGLSSNSIIHFTKTSKALKGILEDNFRLAYCLEQIEIGGHSIEFAVPMVSFCDIPLSEIKSHINKYGKYGIGLTKEWAQNKKLNPVLYIDNKSSLSYSYLTIYKEYIINFKKTSDILDKKEKSIVDILRYIKNYQNKLVRGRKTFKEYRFSDEREWRYLIDFNEPANFILAKEVYTTKVQKEIANKNIRKYRLEFTPNDIKYIIIQRDSEISEFLDVLEYSKGNKYSYNDVKRLMTRIITTEQIMEDF
jgi:hypothetical protein